MSWSTLHAFAVLPLRDGDDGKTVQANPGHAAAFTLDVCGHVSERMKDGSAAGMQAGVGGIQGA